MVSFMHKNYVTVPSWCRSHLSNVGLSFNPLSDDKILDWFKLKQIADDISKAHLK